MPNMERNHGEDTKDGKEYNDGKLRSMSSQYGRNQERNADWGSYERKRKAGTDCARKGNKWNLKYWAKHV